MDILSSKLGLEIIILNIYAPYLNEVDFSTPLLNLSLVSYDNLIIWGDLNFSIGFWESWGSHAHMDPLSDTMTHHMEEHHLINVPMNKLMPTWHNRRTGDAALGRRLDRFLMHEELLQSLALYEQWFGSGGISNHSPIFLEVTSPFKKSKALSNLILPV